MLQIQNYNFTAGLGSRRNWVCVFSYMHKYLTLNKEKAERTVKVHFFFCKCPLLFVKLVAVRRLHFHYSEL